MDKATSNAEGVMKEISWNFSWRCYGRSAIVQIASNQAAILQLDNPEEKKVLTVVSAIKGVHLWKHYYLIWKLNDAEIFELTSQGIEHLAKIGIREGACLAIHNHSVFMTVEDGVEVLSFKGEKKQLLRVDDYQGKALQLEVCEEVLVAVTSENRIRLWKIGQSEVERSGLPSGRKVDQVGKIHSVRCNCDGTKQSFLAESLESGGIEAKLFVYDDYLDKFLCYDFGNRKPVSHCWDDEDSRLLACQTVCAEEIIKLRNGPQMEDADELDEKETAASLISTFFVTSDYPQGIFEYEKIAVLSDQRLLVGVSVPHLIFYTEGLAPSAEELAAPGPFEVKVLRDFVGFEDVDQKTKKGLANFNYNLVLGPIMLVAAYKSISWIQDHAIWKNLAAICVNTKRTDIAAYCFGRMQDAYGVELIEKAEKEPEEDARVAMVAIQLGQIDDAKQLYANCKRYDLLNQLLQFSCEWDKALDVATKHDRVHLKNTHHSYAKYLEARGKYKDAIHHFELSGTHRYEVPRMLYAAQQVDELQDYIGNSSDPALLRWWAHFCEANDLLSEAVEYYIAAGDTCSLVRVHCYQNDFDAAAEVVSSSGNAAGAFQLAREYEKIGDIRQAMHFFKMARKSSYAARLAMKAGMDSELLPLSLQSSKEMMLVSARYFQKKAMGEEAALLYQKTFVGNGNAPRFSSPERGAKQNDFSLLTFSKSSKLCRAEIWARPLISAFVPSCLMRLEVLLKVLMNRQILHFWQSVGIISCSTTSSTRRSSYSLQPSCTIKHLMFVQKKVLQSQRRWLSLFALEKRTKKMRNNHNSSLIWRHPVRLKVLTTLHALLKSGDTERIIFFANVSRQKEILVLAANYLETLDWHGDANIMKTIVQMYTKAGEMESLASFYEACALIELDKFRDYEKAQGAMSEALKYLKKSNKFDKDEKVKSLQTRIAEIEHFRQICRMAKTDPIEMVRACRELLVQLSRNKGFPQTALRVGDVYALLIEFYFRQGNSEQAYQLIEEMRSQKIPISQFVDQSIGELIYQALGMEAAEDLSGGISEEIASLVQS